MAAEALIDELQQFDMNEIAKAAYWLSVLFCTKPGERDRRNCWPGIE